MTIEDLFPQIECTDAFELDNNEVIVVADGKNFCLGFTRDFVARGVDVAHFFAARREEGLLMIRLGKDNAEEGKGNDFSECCRQHEIECILRQHRHSKVKALVIPRGDCSEILERLNMARLVKEADRTIPILFEGSGFAADIEGGAVISVKPSAEEKSRKRKPFFKGDAAITLNPNIDAYYSRNNIDELIDILRSLTKQNKKLGR